LVLIILVGGITFYILKKDDGAVRKSTDQEKVIARVGDENIYQKDLDHEIASYPAIPGVNVEKILLDKLVSDSIVLQAAKEDGLTVDDSVFNSPDKNYAKRVEILKTIREEHAENAPLQGSVISIWFFNTKPGAIGYEAGKELAFEKISAVHQQVKSGAITMEEAAYQIKNDSSLASVDPAYRSNAYFTFNSDGDEPITFDEGFNSVLASLKSGEISDVYLAKDKRLDTGELIDALYMFAKVETSRSSDTASDFDDWVSEEKENYDVVYY
jgi:hypothetical protein